MNISFLGAGKVASALAVRLKESGYHIERIISPGQKNGKTLAEICGAVWSDQPEFPDSTGIIIAAVPDNILENALAAVRCSSHTIVVHTAGSYGLEVFPDSITRKGVFYPLQTFSVGRKVDFKDLPFLIDAIEEEVASALTGLANSLGGRIFRIDASQRAFVHAAAVFICNFTNHMLAAGKRVADHSAIPFDIFDQLIRETVAKAVEIGPEAAQTGPAVRNDRNTIEKHLELLSFSPELKILYREVTASIINFHNKT